MSPREVEEYVAETVPFIAAFDPAQRDAVMDLFIPHPGDHSEGVAPPPWANNADVRSFQQMDRAIAQVQRDPHTKYPNGAISKLVNAMTPAARATWKASMDVANVAIKAGKIAPFKPLSLEELAEHTGADPNEVREIHKNLHNEKVQAGLNKRMGTDLDRKPDPLTLRDHIQGAVDYHESVGSTTGSAASSNAPATTNGATETE